MRRFIGVFCIVLFWASSVVGQNVRVFDSRDAYLDTMHSYMTRLDIKGVVAAFLPPKLIPADSIDGLQAHLDRHFPPELPNHALFVADETQNGLHREIYAYWSGTAYLYALCVYHVRDDAT
ncbi:MAG: hypothetical protein AAF386_11940, partial [Pseudomonadota bacterium]